MKLSLHFTSQSRSEEKNKKKVGKKRILNWGKNEFL